MTKRALDERFSPKMDAEFQIFNFRQAIQNTDEEVVGRNHRCMSSKTVHIG